MNATAPTREVVVTREYTLLRDRIDTVAALASTAQRSVEALDLEAADTMTVEAKVEVADRVWTALMREIARIDT